MEIKEVKFELKKYLRTPEGLLVGGFAAVIFVGALLLWTPFANKGDNIGFLDALFTATSATCVTGLVVADTGSDFTQFGKWVIMLLMQAGGLGVMTFAALLFGLIGKNMGLRSRAALHDSLYQKDAAAMFKKTFVGILTMTAFIEIMGATAMFLFLAPKMRFSSAAFYSMFHSISAFCNAGFSLYRDSLAGLRGHWGIMIVVMTLIILGGLGHTVLLELWQRLIHLIFQKGEKEKPKFSLHARVVFITTFSLLVCGFAGYMIFGLTLNEQGFWSRAGNSLFHTVTARTAGFNTVEIGSLPLASLFLTILLMFIGGSPGSCAGGIKTTTVALWVARMRSVFKGQEEVTLFDRMIPFPLVQRILLLFGLALIWNTFGLLLLFFTERATPGAGMHDIFFEQISAFATAGLSTGLTPNLSAPGKLWIILTMFVGRLGPITFASWALSGYKKVNVRHPEGRIMIG